MPQDRQRSYDADHDQPYEDVEPVEAGHGEESGAEEVAAHGDVLFEQAGVFSALAEQECRAEQDGGDQPGEHPPATSPLQAPVGPPDGEAARQQASGVYTGNEGVEAV